MANNWKYWDRQGVAQEWPKADNGIGGIPLPDGADLFNAEFLNQFVDAVNERYILLSAQPSYGGAFVGYKQPQYEAGDVVTSHFANLFLACYSRYFVFNRAVWGGDPDQEPVPESHDYSDMILTPEMVAEITGLEAGKDPYLSNGSVLPRRSVDGLSFSYGYTQRGDILGKWIFEDMRSALSVLRWTIMPRALAGVFVSQSDAGESWDATYRISDGTYIFPWRRSNVYQFESPITGAQTGISGHLGFKNLWRGKTVRYYPVDENKTYSWSFYATMGLPSLVTEYNDFFGFGGFGQTVKIASGIDTGVGEFSDYIVDASEPPNHFGGLAKGQILNEQLTVFGMNMVYE